VVGGVDGVDFGIRKNEANFVVKAFGFMAIGAIFWRGNFLDFVILQNEANLSGRAVLREPSA